MNRKHSPIVVHGKQSTPRLDLIIVLALSFVVLLFGSTVSIVPPASAQGTYSLPNDDNGCPSNCRQIPWQTGSDLWNGGTLPNYTQVTCSGLAGNGTTNDGPAIQTCINNAASGTA